MCIEERRKGADSKRHQGDRGHVRKESVRRRRERQKKNEKKGQQKRAKHSVARVVILVLHFILIYTHTDMFFGLPLDV